MKASFLLENDAVERGLTTNEAVLAFLSVIIGGGLLSVPFACVHLGIPCGMAVMLLFTFLTQRSNRLYLITIEMLPGKQESFYEIGYMVSG